jgi:predicted TIM-barrel fold metal-dependent hydrolase
MGYVDAHTHLWFPETLDKEALERVCQIANPEIKALKLEKVIQQMDALDIDFVVIMAYPSRRLWGTKEDFPLKVLKHCSASPSRFAVFGGVEPSALSLKETKEALERQYQAGVSGFKIHPPHTWVKPNAYREEEGSLKQLEAIYEFAQDHSLPVTIHTGTSAFPQARNKFGDPIFVDDVAVDFPRLKILIAHMGRPNWVSTAFQLVRIRANIYAELSGIPPKKLLEYVPRVEEISSKALYGSDYGSPGVKGIEQIKDFLSLPIDEHAKREIACLTPKRLIKTLDRG